MCFCRGITRIDINNQNSGSKRQRRSSNILRDHYVLSADDVNLQDDLVNFKEVVANHDVDKLIESMNEELESIKKNDVWELTDLPSQRKAIMLLHRRKFSRTPK